MKRDPSKYVMVLTMVGMIQFIRTRSSYFICCFMVVGDGWCRGDAKPLVVVQPWLTIPAAGAPSRRSTNGGTQGGLPHILGPLMEVIGQRILESSWIINGEGAILGNTCIPLNLSTDVWFHLYGCSERTTMIRFTVVLMSHIQGFQGMRNWMFQLDVLAGLFHH